MVDTPTTGAETPHVAPADPVTPDAVTTGTEVPHDAGHAKAFPPLDPANFAPQLFWLALTFGVLYVILSRVALPRVSEVIEERRDRIQRDLDAAERLKDETDKALSGYEKALSDARSNASVIARKERDALNAEVSAEQAKVEDQLAAKLIDAEARITATKEKALDSVNTIAADTAVAIVSKLVGDEISVEDARRALPSSTAK
ncbi:MAG: F0F1 ATP synthase subunit B [Alphaproteobacteria bacterium]|nr:F0F1 ATP synthase subunit B [Alphaproteobacteria bacterium]